MFQKFRVLLILAVSAFVISTSSGVVSKAQAQFYVSGNAGLSTLMDSNSVTDGLPGVGTFDDGRVLTGAIGYSMGALRVEGEISHRKNDWETFTAQGLSTVVEGDFSSLSFMANGWYDFNTSTNWVPFVGGGIGISEMNMEITSVAGVAESFDRSEQVLAYQFGAGIGYKLTPKATISLSYRLFGTQEVDFGDTHEYLSHSIMVGSRITF
jgi:opacity protein-like surface antigen